MAFTNANSSASSSSRLNEQPQPFCDDDRKASELSLDQSYILQENASSETVTTTRSTWMVRRFRRLAAAHPRLSSRILKYARFLRGPRPMVDLPPPSPLLNINWRTGGHQLTVPIESTIKKATGPLTTPWLMLVCAIAYIIGLSFFSRAQSFLIPADSFISCSSTFWLANDRCGLNGQDCLPLTTSTFDFRCPAQCRNLILQNPRTVGGQQIAFKPLIVGGGDPNGTYRADSFICPAALQAGIISSSRGGCGTVELLGNYTNFTPFTSHGLSSIGFPTIFPLSFRFQDTSNLSQCQDIRNDALVMNILITCILFTILRPKPIILYWCLICIGFWHVALFSQPPSQSMPPKIDVAFGTFLPALYIAYGFWRMAIRYTLPFFSNAPLEACVLYMGPFWVGLLNNLTFDQLPLSRLTASDINKRAGGIATLVVMLVIITILVINQVRVIRKTGWLPYYAGWYCLGGFSILILALLPGLSLRLHHYILPMIILPGSAFPTRLSAIYQGLLLGLFLNGIAAFGLDPIVQTAAALRADAPFGSPLPTFLTNSTNYDPSLPLSNQTLTWQGIPDSDIWDGFSLLVDDVLRYVGTGSEFSLAALNASIPHFFRLAFMSNSDTGDFTMPATLWSNGTWVDPLPGPS